MILGWFLDCSIVLIFLKTILTAYYILVLCFLLVYCSIPLTLFDNIINAQLFVDKPKDDEINFDKRSLWGNWEIERRWETHTYVSNNESVIFFNTILIYIFKLLLCIGLGIYHLFCATVRLSRWTLITCRFFNVIFKHLENISSCNVITNYIRQYYSLMVKPLSCLSVFITRQNIFNYTHTHKRRCLTLILISVYLYLCFFYRNS